MAETKQHSEPRERPGEKPEPTRMCAGCGKRVPSKELVRVVLGEDEAGTDKGSTLAVDLADSRFGRGAHVHPSPDCVAKAFKGGFARVFKAKVMAGEGAVESFGAQLVAAADRRIEGLLAGARRAKHAVSGVDIVGEALRDGSAKLLIVACDAAAAARVSEVQEAVGRGMAIAWSKKESLGALFGRDEVAVCAVLHHGVASAIASAFRMSRPFASHIAAPDGANGARSEAWWSPEVR